MARVHSRRIFLLAVFISLGEIFVESWQGCVQLWDTPCIKLSGGTLSSRCFSADAAYLY